MRISPPVVAGYLKSELHLSFNTSIILPSVINRPREPVFGSLLKNQNKLFTSVNTYYLEFFNGYFKETDEPLVLIQDLCACQTYSPCPVLILYHKNGSNKMHIVRFLEYVI